MPPLRIGYKASAEQFGPRELVEYAVRAEEVGLDSAVVSDHFLPWRHEGGHAPSALAWITAVGERTSRIQLGTSVLTPTFRYNPAVLAQTWASLGLLYPGRVMLGVGTGEALNEIAVSGREWPEFKERFARLREAVRLMRELWTGEEVSFEGEYYRTVNATIYDQPEQPVPVYIAAGGPVVAKYAGRAGDGFICTSGKGMELYTEKLMPAVAEGAQAAGRDPAAIDNMIEIKMSYDRDPAAALENCRFWAPLSLTAEQKHSVDSRGRDGAPRRRAADRAGREAMDRGVGPGRGRRADQALRRRGSQPPRVPRPRPRPGALPHAVRRGRAAEAADPGLTHRPRWGRRHARRAGAAPAGGAREDGRSTATRCR